MELGSRIKQYRAAHGWNQDDLAEKMYVTRQTISNWENNKSYPDLQSLLLLGSLFGVSLDQLVKGDIEIMQKAIDQQDIRAVNRNAALMTVFMVLAALSAVPLAEWLGQNSVPAAASRGSRLATLFTAVNSHCGNVPLPLCNHRADRHHHLG